SAHRVPFARQRFRRQAAGLRPRPTQATTCDPPHQICYDRAGGDHRSCIFQRPHVAAPAGGRFPGTSEMRERFAEISTLDGRMQAFVTHPAENGPFPAVIVYMDVFGLREELYDVARRIATVGYYAMVPDFYYRNGKMRIAFPAHKRRWTLADLDK